MPEHQRSNAPAERRTLLLTGASRGIGHATVKRFASAGWRVLACSRQPFPENCPWEGGRDDHIQVDLANPDDTIRAIEEIRSKDGKSSEKNTLMKDHPRFQKSGVVVLAQTETDLILGMQTSDNYEWKHPSRNSHHLPFLWKVSKQEILKQLNND